MSTALDKANAYRPLRILIIEDNPDGRETLRVLLELLGHQVTVAADGADGVEKALAGRPEVVLVDIGLPRLDGYQVARKLRAALDGRAFLIAQTGYGRPEDRLKALAAGFDVHLVKPLNLEDICHWLAVAANRTAAARDHSPAPRQHPPTHANGNGSGGTSGSSSTQAMMSR